VAFAVATRAAVATCADAAGFQLQGVHEREHLLVFQTRHFVSDHCHDIELSTDCQEQLWQSLDGLLVCVVSLASTGVSAFWLQVTNHPVVL